MHQGEKLALRLGENMSSLTTTKIRSIVAETFPDLPYEKKAGVTAFLERYRHSESYAHDECIADSFSDKLWLNRFINIVTERGTLEFYLGNAREDNPLFDVQGHVFYGQESIDEYAKYAVEVGSARSKAIGAIPLIPRSVVRVPNIKKEHSWNDGGLGIVVKSFIPKEQRIARLMVYPEDLVCISKDGGEFYMNVCELYVHKAKVASRQQSYDAKILSFSSFIDFDFLANDDDLSYDESHIKKPVIDSLHNEDENVRNIKEIMNFILGS